MQDTVKTALFIFSIVLCAACGRNPAEVPAGEGVNPAAAAAPNPAAEPPQTQSPGDEIEARAKASVHESRFGTFEEKPVRLFTLTKEHGLVAKVIDYGATLTEMHVPDRNGELADVARGFEAFEPYLSDKNPYFGATIGRFANRTKDASFELGERRYSLTKNLGRHHLQGGTRGWAKVLWQAEVVPAKAAVRFRHSSPDGDQGYPGTVSATVTYSLGADDALTVTMEAESDAPTIINMAHHSYWNLGGPSEASVKGQLLTLFADEYLVAGEDAIPSGEAKAVAGTPFDFRTTHAIGDQLLATGGDPVGYDHTYLVRGEASSLRPFARLEDPKSGRVLELEANQPALQFYTSNFMDGSATGRGAVHAQYSSLCLESEVPPNSANLSKFRESAVLEPGRTYRHVMVHRFSVSK
jgi:aldose 1-epimerase